MSVAGRSFLVLVGGSSGSSRISGALSDFGLVLTRSLLLPYFSNVGSAVAMASSYSVTGSHGLGPLLDLLSSYSLAWSCVVRSSEYVQ